MKSILREPLALVLGAGSSVTYGFPTGAQLRRLLCDDERAGDKYQLDVKKCFRGMTLRARKLTGFKEILLGQKPQQSIVSFEDGMTTDIEKWRNML